MNPADAIEVSVEAANPLQSALQYDRGVQSILNLRHYPMLETVRVPYRR